MIVIKEEKEKSRVKVLPRKFISFLKNLFLKNRSPKIFLYLLLSIPFLIGAIWQFRANNPFVSKIPIIESFVNSAGSSGIHKITFTLFLISFPFLLITALEIFRSKIGASKFMLITE